MVLASKESELIKLNDKAYGIAFKSAEIDFPEYEAMKKQVDSMRDQFTKYTVTPENIKSARETKKQINKFKESLNKRKIEIVKTANKPVDDFQEKIKVLVTEAKEAYDHINDQIKAYEEEEKKHRHELKVKRIKKVCEEAGVDENEIIYGQKWDNKSFSNTNFESELNQQVQALVEKRKLYEANQKLVIQQADNLGLPADHWLKLLSYGRTIDEVVNQMNNYKQELKDMAEKQKEEKIKHAKEDSKLINKAGKAVDPKTGEIKDKMFSAVLVTKKAKIKIEGTKFQFDQLFKYLQDMGFKCVKEEN